MRWTTIVAGVVVLAACGIDGAPVSAGQPGIPAPAAPSVTADRLDALLVPVSAVPGGLHPAGSASVPSTMSMGCAGDDASWFGPNTQGFRSARYSGVGNRYVAQSVGLYASAEEAAAVFRAAAQQVASCGNGSLSVDSVGGQRAAWHVSGTSAVSGANGVVAGYAAGVVGNVVFRVGAGLFDDPVAVANSVADGIAANIGG